MKRKDNESGLDWNWEEPDESVVAHRAVLMSTRMSLVRGFKQEKQVIFIFFSNNGGAGLRKREEILEIELQKSHKKGRKKK